VVAAKETSAAAAARAPTRRSIVWRGNRFRETFAI
jgi:hypothetical protein